MNSSTFDKGLVVLVICIVLAFIGAIISTHIVGMAKVEVEMVKAQAYMEAAKNGVKLDIGLLK